jgi:hypothetical protein
VLCYRQTRGSLVGCFKHCLDNMFVAQQASRAFNLYEFSGLGPIRENLTHSESARGQWQLPGTDSSENPPEWPRN